MFLVSHKLNLQSNVISFIFLQDDGGKKIELKPGFLMEHDEDVYF